MHLRRLTIHALPGIEPGFAFEPPSADINIVTGPNAIGKSSLARALQYLLESHGSDPPALSLEAEFDGGDARWKVTRNGGRIVWRCNGEVASRPALPGADRVGLFRLSVENLLDDSDANDQALAERLRRELHGNFDLGQPRIELGRLFARHEARQLAEAERARRRVENEYVDLQRQEAGLPTLERQIEKAVAARARSEHLAQALGLADAIDARKDRESALAQFPPEMDRLRGDELEQLEESETRASKLNEELRERQRDLQTARASLERTGLAQATPAPEEVHAAEERLRQLGRQSVELDNVRSAVAEADAALRDVLAHFNPEGAPPKLDSEAIRRADSVAQPLVAAQNRRRELQEQLALAGEAPEATELERHRDGAEALRAWLAGNDVESSRTGTSTKLPRLVSWVALAAAAVAAVTALMYGVLVAFAGALAAAIALGVALFLLHGRRSAVPSPVAAAIRRFEETDLPPPSQWNEQDVRRHLRDVIEVRLNEMTLQRARAAYSERIRLQMNDADAAVERLEEERTALASEIGFDPRLPVTEFQRFIHLCSEWDKARSRHAQQRERLDLLERDIKDTVDRVRKFADPWRVPDAPALEDAAGWPDVVLLHGAFDDLRERIDAAGNARNRILAGETAIQSLEQRLAEVHGAVERLFARADVEAHDRAALAARIEQLPRWKEANTALHTANTEEALARVRLAEQPDLVALADEGERTRLQAELEAASVEAAEHTRLIQEHTTIRTRLNDAGKERKLEQTAAEEGAARQALEDKRDDALLAVATGTLLDDVERAFEAEHEPAVLRRARDLFAEVTARAFVLQLRGDGAFIARDVRQETARELAELSSGTRMQLLLAVRLAWIETQEQGGETLPLFLDEALTTSDEERFAVMAQSMERLAGPGDEGATGAVRGRQIFYLSARRHEPALWQQATGTRPTVIDLASVRFPPEALAPEEYRVDAPPPIPAPNDASAERYASLLGVLPRPDFHQPEGGIHLFHLLRDDLTLLHTLMDTWRIRSLGQLEFLLASDAAQSALAADDLRRGLRQRCRVVRTWVELWRQGRGRRVDRGVLEQSTAVSATYIDRAGDLAARVGGDGEALVRALRAGELGRFRTRKIDELERWLADEGYTDDQERLTSEDRRRLTLQRIVAATDADAADVNRVVSWLEAGTAAGEGGCAETEHR